MTNAVAGVEPSTVSVRGVKATRSAARLDLIDIQPLTGNEYGVPARAVCRNPTSAVTIHTHCFFIISPLNV
jgi:hypothetical protein